MALLKKNAKQPKEIYFGDGLNFETGRLQKIVVPDANRSGHFWCFGTTRVGKTRMLENMVEEDIKKGYNVMIIDPKGDIELFSKITQIAIETGRKSDLMLLNPIFPSYSIKLNPLQYYYMIEELVAIVMSGVKTGKEPFFFNVGYETTTMAIQVALYLTMKHKEMNNDLSVLTFQDIMDITGRSGLEELVKQMQSAVTEEDAYGARLLADLSKITESPADYFAKISSSLRVALMELTQGNIGKVIGSAKENKVIERLENNEGLIFVVQAPSLLAQQAATTVGKVLLSMISALVGRKFVSGLKMQPPLCVYVDEAQSILYQGIEDIFAKAGGAGVWMHCFSQSVNQIYHVLGNEAAAKSILDNINTKVFMRAPDEETANYVVKHFGESKKFAPVLNTGGGNLSVREEVRDVLKKQNILSLQKRQFFMMTYEGRFRGETRNISEALLDIKFPKAENNRDQI